MAGDWEGKIEAEAITLSYFVCFCLEIHGENKDFPVALRSILPQPDTAQYSLWPHVAPEHLN